MFRTWGKKYIIGKRCDFYGFRFISRCPFSKFEATRHSGLDGPYQESAKLEETRQALAVICTLPDINVKLNKCTGSREGGTCLVHQ